MDTNRQVFVCQHVSCTHNGSAEVLAALLQQPIPGTTVCASDCLGQCHMGPTLHVTPDEIWYCRVKPGDIQEIVDAHLLGGDPVTRLLHPRFHPQFGV